MRWRALVKELLKLAGNNSPLAGLGPNEVGGLDGGLCALEDRVSSRELCVNPWPRPARGGDAAREIFLGIARGQRSWRGA